MDKDIDDKREISIGERDSVFDSADEAYKKRALDPEMPTTTSPEKKTGGHLGLVVSGSAVLILPANWYQIFSRPPGTRRPLRGARLFTKSRTKNASSAAVAIKASMFSAAT